MEKVFKNKRTGEIAYYKDGILKSGRCAVEIGHEPSLEFWDLVEDEKESNFKVLIFTNPDNGLRYAPKNGEYKTICNDGYSDIGIRSFNYCKRFYNIESVQRLSDGEIFTVGDKAKSYTDNTPRSIKSFNIVKRYILNEPKGDYVFVNWDKNAGHAWLDGTIKIREEIVLKTNDGVDLKFGDKYFVVDASRFNIFEASAGITFKTERWKGCGFSTRELAEEWVLMNKPLLSLEDLLSVWGYDAEKELYSKSPLFYNFKELAEKKLKN